VCRLRGIPIFTFINKLDREGRDPFDLMDELEQVLGIRSYPMNWPIGSGKRFKGIYDREHRQVEVFRDEHHDELDLVEVNGLEDEQLKTIAGEHYDDLCEQLELLDVAGDPFDEKLVETGELSPVFFGS